MLLRIDGVAKSFNKSGKTLAVLGGISLSLEPGDLTAVEGASGSGKSTLLMIAGGLMAPDKGKVEVAGHDLYALSPNERAAVRARQIGFVFQQFHLVPYLSVLDNVAVPALAHAANGARARAMELIERFGLKDRASHTPAELSIGERQRAALARALLLKPQLLFADEPTGNLDAANAGAVFDCFKEFVQQGGAALLVTHDALASACARTRLRLKDGALSPATTN